MFQGLFDGDGQLIGTGGTAVTAGIPFQELYGPGGIGIFQQLAESQGIARTAAYEMDVMQFAVFQAEGNLTGTSPWVI